MLPSHVPDILLDGYINENGTINVKRLQVILDEMADWERDIFEKEYADLNWYKGKQAKHVKETDNRKKQQKRGTWSPTSWPSTS